MKKFSILTVFAVLVFSLAVNAGPFGRRGRSSGCANGSCSTSTAIGSSFTQLDGNVIPVATTTCACQVTGVCTCPVGACACGTTVKTTATDPTIPEVEAKIAALKAEIAARQAIAQPAPAPATVSAAVATYTVRGGLFGRRFHTSMDANERIGLFGRIRAGRIRR